MVSAIQEINLQQTGQQAKHAAHILAQQTTETKNQALLAIADALETQTDKILQINEKDLIAAEEAGIDPLYIRDRLNLANRMTGIIADVRKVAELPDPVGREFDQRTLENGMKFYKKRVPLGVLGVIYEARPNVTVDIACLGLKTGNAVILRGGKESFHTNIVLVEILQEALESVGLPANCVQYIENTDRKYVSEMLRLYEYIDMIIPRGGNGLHTFCRENSSIPVITGGIGICHLYVDESADLDASLPIIHNAKTQRPAVCNALDTLLVHEAVAETFLPRVVENLGKDGVVFKAEPVAHEIVGKHVLVEAAGEDDFDTEWYALILGLKVVHDLEEAIEHIREHSTQHSDGILTYNMEHATQFLNEVDSAAVYLNASTRFTDGSAMGMGAEVAISTQKLHARGPMALEELTTYKWIGIGDWHIRE